MALASACPWASAKDRSKLLPDGPQVESNTGPAPRMGKLTLERAPGVVIDPLTFHTTGAPLTLQARRYTPVPVVATVVIVYFCPAVTLALAQSQYDDDALLAIKV